MSVDDLLRLLGIASRCAPSCPDDCAIGAFLPRAPRPPTPDEWATHLLTYALALNRAIEAKVVADERADEEAAAMTALAADADHLNECAQDHCAAGCPDALRKSERLRHDPLCEPYMCVWPCPIARAAWANIRGPDTGASVTPGQKSDADEIGAGRP